MPVILLLSRRPECPKGSPAYLHFASGSSGRGYDLDVAEDPEWTRHAADAGPGGGEGSVAGAGGCPASGYLAAPDVGVVVRGCGCCAVGHASSAGCAVAGRTDGGRLADVRRHDDSGALREGVTGLPGVTNSTSGALEQVLAVVPVERAVVGVWLGAVVSTWGVHCHGAGPLDTVGSMVVPVGTCATAAGAMAGTMPSGTVPEGVVVTALGGHRSGGTPSGCSRARSSPGRRRRRVGRAGTCARSGSTAGSGTRPFGSARWP